ncbi:MAG TPA: hypothetical protein QF625_02585, partial [Candidatus Scalindua sp.]|nr:hypothetical protein [Candidatus Scalindua sp.]
SPVVISFVMLTLFVPVVSGLASPGFCIMISSIFLIYKKESNAKSKTEIYHLQMRESIILIHCCFIGTMVYYELIVNPNN